MKNNLRSLSILILLISCHKGTEQPSIHDFRLDILAYKSKVWVNDSLFEFDRGSKVISISGITEVKVRIISFEPSRYYFWCKVYKDSTFDYQKVIDDTEHTYGKNYEFILK